MLFLTDSGLRAEKVKKRTKTNAFRPFKNFVNFQSMMLKFEIGTDKDKNSNNLICVMRHASYLCCVIVHKMCQCVIGRLHAHSHAIEEPHNDTEDLFYFLRLKIILLYDMQ